MAEEKEINLATCTPDERTAYWSKQANDRLAGKTIREARYLTEEEANNLGWEESALVIFFTDGSYIFPSSDDEGNRPGALYTSFENLPIIPVV